MYDILQNVENIVIVSHFQVIGHVKIFANFLFLIVMTYKFHTMDMHITFRFHSTCVVLNSYNCLRKGLIIKDCQNSTW